MEAERLPIIRNGIDERFGLTEDQLMRAAEGLPDHADMEEMPVPKSILGALSAGRIQQPDILPNLKYMLGVRYNRQGLRVGELVARTTLIGDLAQTCIQANFGSKQPQS